MKGMPHERIPSSPTFVTGDPGCCVFSMREWEIRGSGFPIKDVGNDVVGGGGGVAVLSRRSLNHSNHDKTLYGKDCRKKRDRHPRRSLSGIQVVVSFQ